MIKSKFRQGFWIRLAIQIIFSIGLIVFCLYYLLSQDKFDPLNILFLVAVITFISLIHLIYDFINHQYARITVNKDGIEITNVMTLKSRTIKYKEIIKFSKEQVTISRGPYIVPSHEIINILLNDDTEIVLSQDLYDNYFELKRNIYYYFKIMNDYA